MERFWSPLPGMNSEVGHIAKMLGEQKTDKSPLTKQIDHITLIIIGLAGIAFLSISCNRSLPGGVVYDLVHHRSISAIGSIPDALPAVVTMILSIGTVAMAKKNAIIKNLPGCRNAGVNFRYQLRQDGNADDEPDDCPLNSATVKHRYMVSGEGYSFEGKYPEDPG